MKRKNLLLTSVVFAGIILVSGAVEGDAEELLRVYNPNTGQHHYTVSGAERYNLIYVGWRNEGASWVAPNDKGDLVYRMYNENNGDHHYTTNSAEKEMLVSSGWKYEGTAFRSGGEAPVYRLYNPNAKQGYHHYTLNAQERDMLKGIGWHDEGVGFYAEKAPDVKPANVLTNEELAIAAYLGYETEYQSLEQSIDYYLAEYSDPKSTARIRLIHTPEIMVSQSSMSSRIVFNFNGDVITGVSHLSSGKIQFYYSVQELNEHFANHREKLGQLLSKAKQYGGRTSTP